MKKTNNTYIAIMAGGAGTRFWPRSRSSFPKQFLDILGTGRTLLQETFERSAQLVDPQNILILTNYEYAPIVREQLLDLPEENIIVEPLRKNTGTCLCFLTHYIQQLSPNATLVALPSDHLIGHVEKYNNYLLEAIEFSQKHDALLTLGIQPSSPHTGYGYIQMSEKVKDYSSIFKVKTFTEKPNLELAKQFLSVGEFLWNAGIFVWNIQHGLNAMDKYMPQESQIFHQYLSSYMKTSHDKLLQHNLLTKMFQQCRNISIDYALFEHAQNVFVVSAEFEWNDLGSWTTVYDLHQKDDKGNVSINKKKSILIDSSNCLVDVNPNKLVLMDGLNDYIVVDTHEALMICKKDKAQEIKNYLELIKERGEEDYL